MFQVHNDWEFPGMNGMFNDGIKTYRYIRIALHSYQFWVEQRVESGGAKFVDQALLCSVHDLLDIISEDNDIRINLISPYHANETREVSMCVIKEIYRLENNSEIGFLYNCSNGKSYIDQLEEFVEDRPTQKELIYSCKGIDFWTRPDLGDSTGLLSSDDKVLAG